MSRYATPTGRLGSTLYPTGRGRRTGASTDLFGLDGLGVAGIPQRYDRTGFVGARPCPGGLVVRSIDLFPDRIEILDLVPGENASHLRLESQAEAIRLLPPGVPYSPGYGWQERR
jgi:hypothetical protein